MTVILELLALRLLSDSFILDAPRSCFFDDVFKAARGADLLLSGDVLVFGGGFCFSASILSESSLSELSEEEASGFKQETFFIDAGFFLPF
jgi:hypothetical protein